MHPTDGNGVAVPTTGYVDWRDVWRRAEMPFNPDARPHACRDPVHCGKPMLCDLCAAWQQVLQEREKDAQAKWLAEGRLAGTLERVRRLAAVYGAELAAILKPIVFALFEAWWTTVKGEAQKALEKEVAKQIPAAARSVAGVLAEPDGVGRDLRQRFTHAMLPEIEDHLIDVVLGVLDARADSTTTWTIAEPIEDTGPEPVQGDEG